MSRRGQASVELVGAVPAVLLVALVLFQLLAAGYSLVMADHAVESAAIAFANGRDPGEAASRAVPLWPKQAISVSRSGERLTVTLKPPSPLKALSSKLAVESSVVARGPKGSR